MNQLELSTLISEEKIKGRIKELGNELTESFRNKDLITICVLKGAVIFFSELVRRIDTNVTCEFLAISSYQATQSTGEVRLTLDLASPIKDKHVLLVEDIADTGLSLNYLQKSLHSRQPKSLTTVALVQKPEAKKVDYVLDYVGFEIPNKFIVGYGMDYNQYYRNLPYIAQVENMN